MNVYLAVILVSLALAWLLGCASKWLTARRLAPQPPAEFTQDIDGPTFAKSQKYTKASMRFEIVSETASLLVLFAVILTGGFDCLDQLIRPLGYGPITTGLLFIGTIGLISFFINLPFMAYHTFVLENRFGFNTTTWKTFVGDQLKSLLLSGILAGLLVAAILAFFQAMGAWAWVWCWGFAMAFLYGVTYIAPTWILPLFNKFTPLEDGELRSSLEAYAAKTDFELSGIFVMDGSKRSNKANAFFTGFGKRKRIALFDTLMKQLSTEEILAVLAHEVGHCKKGHIKKRLAASIIKTGATFFLMSLMLDNRELFAAFGMEHVSTYAGLVFFALLYTPVSMVLSVIGNAMSRKHEYEADRYAADTTGNGDAMKSALKKLSVTNLSNLTPHPFTVWLEYSHPPVLKRIRALTSK